MDDRLAAPEVDLENRSERGRLAAGCFDPEGTGGIVRDGVSGAAADQNDASLAGAEFRIDLRAIPQGDAGPIFEHPLAGRILGDDRLAAAIAEEYPCEAEREGEEQRGGKRPLERQSVV